MMVETPFSCCVTPYTMSEPAIVCWLCVMIRNCESDRKSFSTSTKRPMLLSSSAASSSSRIAKGDGLIS